MSVDFEKLRAERNAMRRAFLEKMKSEGFELVDHCADSDDSACYCACPDGPCEHTWDGPEWQSQDGCQSSATCSRCGATALHHDLRVMP